jgi:ribonuclease PH
MPPCPSAGQVIRNTLEQTVVLELLPRSQIDVYVQVGV